LLHPQSSTTHCLSKAVQPLTSLRQCNPLPLQSSTKPSVCQTPHQCQHKNSCPGICGTLSYCYGVVGTRVFIDPKSQTNLLSLLPNHTISALLLQQPPSPNCPPPSTPHTGLSLSVSCLHWDSLWCNGGGGGVVWW
jgi:hypothetical protein